MIKAYYALGAVDWAAVGNRIWNTVTSKTALLVYSVVILVLVIVLAEGDGGVYLNPIILPAMTAEEAQRILERYDF